MPTYTDATGTTIDPPGVPGRVVSLVPSLTEALFAYGVGGRVVGVTRFCVEPAAELQGVQRIGGTKDVDADAVIALAPNLVLANVEENTREDIGRLQEAGLPVFVTYPRTVASAIEELATLAEMMGAAEGARESLDDARSELAKAAAAQQRVFCPIWRRPWMTIGPDTYIHDMLRVGGGENVFADATERYPEVDLREVTRRGPTVVLLPDEPYPFEEKHTAEVIEALGPVRICLMDGKDLCWYGPRIGPAIRSLRRLLAPSTGSG